MAEPDDAMAEQMRAIGEKIREIKFPEPPLSLQAGGIKFQPNPSLKTNDLLAEMIDLQADAEKQNRRMARWNLVCTIVAAGAAVVSVVLAVVLR